MTAKCGTCYWNVSYPSPEGEGLSAALSRSVPKSEICPSLQASLHAATICRGSCLAGTLASDLPKTASNRISAVPFRARVWQSRTGSASNGLPRGCLRCPSTAGDGLDMLNMYAEHRESKLGSVPNSSRPLKETGLLGDFSVTIPSCAYSYMALYGENCDEWRPAKEYERGRPKGGRGGA